MILLPKQIEAITKMQTKQVGIVCLPTAAGKTVIIYGHAKTFFNENNIKHNFIISGPIMDLNEQTASSVITNLFNDGLVNSENCDIVIANCANHKCNTFYTVFDGSKIVLAEKLNGRVPANIIVNTIDIKQEKQYRITVVCNPTLQNDEKFLNKLNNTNVINHFYFDESQTLKKGPSSKSTESLDIQKSKEDGKNWVNYKKIFDMINSNNGSCYFVSATPTKENFDTIIEHGYGLNAEDCFAYRLTPLEAINAHMIVRPEFTIRKVSKLGVSSILQMINLMVEHIKNIKKENINYKARILVTVNSTQELEYIEQTLIDLYKDEYDVYSTCCINKKKKNLKEIPDDIVFFKESIENNERSCFVVHIRQIIAGIDIPSFTHAVFNMESSTNFIAPIQITGRVLRGERRFANGEVDTSNKQCGYIYVNIEDNNDKAMAAARTLVDHYGAIFKFLKPDFFNPYESGSNKRDKHLGQFEDDIEIKDFDEYISKFLHKTAKFIYEMHIIGIDYNIEGLIEENIKGKAYVENVPVFVTPELQKYVNKVKDYIELLAE